ncbi:unnamed protein product [Notodromas monacha]|uniref:F-box domain-containing protein n=1 Tax=Notodromas monacha TaxID=399045 RepID=A0A7R9GDE9_9CRUS|nr:unnamed protein product [Notodromas monacha]CAG0918474.1 unnamed protein product [Notodromas monacha]
MVLTRQACSASNEDFGLRECTITTRSSSQNANAGSVLPKKNLLDLPAEILMKMLGFLPMKKVSESRMVCRRFNAIGGELLTSTFQRLQLYVLKRFNCIKHQMPRRESARRNHPRAREADIMETLSMRLSLLQMAFGRHIQKGNICFFPGEILDEVQRILTCISATPEISKAYKITEELYDLSAMAMEYFKEKLEPTLPEISYFNTEFTYWDDDHCESSGSTLPPPAIFGEGPSHPGLVPMPLPMAPPPPISWRDETESISSDVTSASSNNAPASDVVMKRSFRRIRLGMQKNNLELIRLRKDLKTCKARVSSQKKLLSKYHTRLDEYDKKFEENTKKFSTLIQELNKCKTELQYWRAKAPVEQTKECENCGHVMVNTAMVWETDPIEDSKDRRALAHQGIIIDKPSSSDLISASLSASSETEELDIAVATALSSISSAESEEDASETEEEVVTMVSPGKATRGVKKAAMLGKRKRKAVDLAQPSCSHHQLPPPSASVSGKNLRHKAGKQPVAKMPAGKRVKL